MEDFETGRLDVVRRAFRGATPCDLMQAWREKPGERFEPAWVQMRWRNDSLLVFAELKDKEVFTLARTPNERLWELGDTFEIFLRPIGQQAYVEFHISPK